MKFVKSTLFRTKKVKFSMKISRFVLGWWTNFDLEMCVRNLAELGFRAEKNALLDKPSVFCSNLKGRIFSPFVIMQIRIRQLTLSDNGGQTCISRTFHGSLSSTKPLLDPELWWIYLWYSGLFGFAKIHNVSQNYKHP